MPVSDPFHERKLQRLQCLIYLFPFVGVIPAIWTVSHRQARGEQRATSRLSVTLTLSWLVLYGLLWFGASQGGEVASFRLLYVNGIVTSAYIVTCLLLMLRIGQGKSNQ